MWQKHILECLLNQLYFNLKKKTREGKKKTKRRVLLSLCGYEALRWPLWAIRGKAFFWACMGLTVQLGRKQSMQATWGMR